MNPSNTFISEINYANFIFVGHLGKKGRTRSRYVRDECGQIVNIIVKRQWKSNLVLELLNKELSYDL